MPRRIAVLVPLVAYACVLGGCGEKKAAVVYERPLNMDDLARGVPPSDNAHTLLTDRRTEGRFACVLAIAKMRPGADELDFVQMSPPEQSYWVEQMRGVTTLRKLTFLRPRSTRPFGHDVPRLCETADRLGAPLLLVYAPNGVGANSAQVLGVLYDAATHQPLASLHASARFLNEEGQEVSPNEEKGDHRDDDARYQAQRAFEGHVLACVRDLMSLDDQPATTQPHRWQQPFVERWWIRYH